MFTSKHDRYLVHKTRAHSLRSPILSLAVATIAGSIFPSAAHAQATPIVSQPEAYPLAQPLLGQVSANRALSLVAAADIDRFTISPNLVTDYDTNILRRAQPAGTDTGNLRVTPGVGLILRRSLGRFAFNLSGTAGYDFNSRYRFLNRSRIDFAGGVKAPVGAICTANFAANFDQYQFDLTDVTQTVGTTTRNQNYDLALGCPRAAGLSPVAGVAYHIASSGGVSLYNYTQLSEHGGIAYAQPSLGIITLTAAASQIRRPNIVELIGIDDSTNIRSLTLSIDRAVSHRVQLSLAAGYTEANPSRAGASSFAGPSFNGRINWNILPLLSITTTAVRQVTGQNGISAAYVIRDDYVGSLNWQFSRASRVGLSGSHTTRDLRGEALTPMSTQIMADRSTNVTANYHYDTARWLRLGLSVGHRWRTADNPIYNYQSTNISGSIGTRF